MTKEQQREVVKQSLAEDLKKAYLRMQLCNPIIVSRLLKNYQGEQLMEYTLNLIDPPATPEEVKIQLLSDMVIDFTFPKVERKIETIIWKALGEIRKAYAVISQKGGGPGWSSDPNKDTPNKRQMAVLEWYRHNQARLTYLKEAHLQDTNLYNPGSGQQKRNFVARLIIKIVQDETNENLTFQKVKAHLENLKKIQQPLRFEEL
ncbi:MAG: hypothetical protein NTY36_03490 [Deltaproteobacteria bacterium]|nr:hypothetical protein [Deltaproteobacteria bacterium]